MTAYRGGADIYRNVSQNAQFLDVFIHVFIGDVFSLFSKILGAFSNEKNFDI